MKVENICICHRKNWVDYLPRMAFNISNITALAFQTQKSNFVTTLNDNSQGQREITKVYKVHTTEVYKKWSIKPESLLIMGKKTVMKATIL